MSATHAGIILALVPVIMKRAVMLMRQCSGSECEPVNIDDDEGYLGQ
jgi:hypothetical protein